MLHSGEHDDGKHQLYCAEHLNEESPHDRAVTAQSDIYCHGSGQCGRYRSSCGNPT